MPIQAKNGCLNSMQERQQNKKRRTLSSYPMKKYKRRADRPEVENIHQLASLFQVKVGTLKEFFEKFPHPDAEQANKRFSFEALKQIEEKTLGNLIGEKYSQPLKLEPKDLTEMSLSQLFEIAQASRSMSHFCRLLGGIEKDIVVKHFLEYGISYEQLLNVKSQPLEEVADQWEEDIFYCSFKSIQGRGKKALLPRPKYRPPFEAKTNHNNFYYPMQLTSTPNSFWNKNNYCWCGLTPPSHPQITEKEAEILTPSCLIFSLGNHQNK
jgi:hypothetical protein